MNTHEELLNSAIIPWAIADDNVTSLAEMGSRVDREPADEWADLDLLIPAHDVERILDDDRRITSIIPYWLALKHQRPFEGTPVRQVLFEGGLDFDIVPVTSGSLIQRSDHPAFRALLGDGFRILIGKEGELEWLPSIPKRSGGRHIEDWASDRFVLRLRDTFATYDERGIAAALIEVMELFHEVTQETAALLGLSYPTASHERIETWMRSTLEPVLVNR